MVLHMTHRGQIGMIGRLHTVPVGAVCLVRSGLMVASTAGRIHCPVIFRRALEMIRGARVMLFYILRRCSPGRCVEMSAALAAVGSSPARGSRGIGQTDERSSTPMMRHRHAGIQLKPRIIVPVKTRSATSSD
jgi:hypothetical protein